MDDDYFGSPLAFFARVTFFPIGVVCPMLSDPLLYQYSNTILHPLNSLSFSPLCLYHVYPS